MTALPASSPVPEQQMSARLHEFARGVHASLDPREVAYLLANEGRQLLACDQLSVAVCRGTSAVVEAVSGAVSPEARSPLCQTMRRLFQAVLDWGQPLVYAGARDESLPPVIFQALDAFLGQSACKLLILLPLRDRRQGEQDRPRSALLAEWFHPAGDPAALHAQLEALGAHASSALYNAAEHRRLPLRWLSVPLAGLRENLLGGSWARAGVVVGLVLATVAALALVPAPLRLEARGELLPRERQIVYASVNGKVVEMKARPGEYVARGQELLLVEDLELQLQLDQLALKVSAAEQRVAGLGQQLGRVTSGEERHALDREKINQEYELRKAAVERDILLESSRSPRKTPVTSPLAGRLVTFDAREQLVGKSVKVGDALLRVARVQGPWEVELHIPEGSVGPVREGLDQAGDAGLTVNLLLASHPHRTYQGRLTRDGLGGETVVKDEAVVLPARVQITDRDLLTLLEGMPVGVEVRAKVNCGLRPVGSVWFFDLWELIYEHVWF